MTRAIVGLCLPLLLCIACKATAAEDRAARDAEVVSIDLPFTAARLAMSADGQRVVVWNAVRGGADPQRLAVVDLERRETVAQTTFQSPLFDVVVGEDVYVAEGKGIARLSADRLDSQAVWEAGGRPAEFSIALDTGGRPAQRSNAVINTGDRPTQLTLVAKRRLSAGARMRLALPDLSLIENYDHDVNGAEGWLDGRCGFGWFLEGVLWDDALDKPLLLVWPYEFHRVPWQNVLQRSLRQPGEFQPTAGAWHPFSTKSTRKPDGAVLAVATSPDVAATLAVVKDLDEYHLASFRLDTGKRIANIPLAPADAESARTPRLAAGIATGGKRFAVLLFNRLYVGSLKELRGTDSLPFHVVPRQSTFVLATDKPTTVRYEAVGATRFRLSSRMLGRDDKPFEATSESGEFTLPGVESVNKVLDCAAGLAANLPQGRDLTDNHQRAALYAGPPRSAYRRLFGHEAKGVPLPIDIQVIAEGTDFETAVLRHDFLVELPLERLEDALDRLYPAGQNPWSKPAREFSLTDYPATASPPTDNGRPFDYLRELWATPRPAVTGEKLHQAAKQAKEAGDKRLHERYVKWIADRQWRTWTDAEGQSTEALLVQHFVGQVTLRTREGVELTFDEEKLGDADRAFIRNMAEPATPNDSDDWREFVFTQSLQAVIRFHNVRNLPPPRALVDVAGQPRVSWRVLLLRELGYGELFSLFRLDEPWNSDHNRALIPFSPNCLAVNTKSAAEGKTTLMTIYSPLSVMQTGGMSSLRHFGGKASSTVVFVEAIPARATEWTKPVDLALYEFADPTSVVHARDDRMLVGLLSGKVLNVAADTSPDDWRLAINRGELRRLFEHNQP